LVMRNAAVLRRSCACLGGHMAAITGDGTDNTLPGTAGDDSIVGLGGNDLITADTGNDTIDGGTGDDTRSGGDGNDCLVGAAGGDLLLGGAGFDTFTGLSGNDTIDGGVNGGIIKLSEIAPSLTAASDGQIANIGTVTAAGSTAGVLVDLHNQTEAFTITGSSN